MEQIAPYDAALPLNKLALEEIFCFMSYIIADYSYFINILRTKNVQTISNRLSVSEFLKWSVNIVF